MNDGWKRVRDSTWGGSGARRRVRSYEVILWKLLVAEEGGAVLEKSAETIIDQIDENIDL